METTITGRNVTITDRFRAYAEEKVGKVETLAPRAMSAQVKVSRHHDSHGAAGGDRAHVHGRAAGAAGTWQHGRGARAARAAAAERGGAARRRGACSGVCAAAGAAGGAGATGRRQVDETTLNTCTSYITKVIKVGEICGNAAAKG